MKVSKARVILFLLLGALLSLPFYTIVRFDLLFVLGVWLIIGFLIFRINFKIKIFVLFVLIVVLVLYFFSPKKIGYSLGPMPDFSGNIVINRYECICDGFYYNHQIMGGAIPQCLGGELRDCRLLK